MIIVSNSTPLISLAAIELFDLLKVLYGTIFIPEEVYEEVVIRGQGPFGSKELASASWIMRRAVNDHQKVTRLMATKRLHRGESEAIALAIEMKAARIILDDRVARQYAEANAIPIIGTIGILLLAKSQKLITHVKPYLDALKGANIRIGDRVYYDALHLAGEQSS